MYAHVKYIQSPPGQLDEGLKVLREYVLPVATKRHGFRGILSLVDRKAEKSIVITLWETEADLAGHVESSFIKEAVAKHSSYFEGVQPPESYEVDLAELHK